MVKTLRVAAVAVGVLASRDAAATWSIVAVDAATGEVGAAGATCGPMVWMIADLEAGAGAAVSLCATRMKARRPITEALAAGDSPADALAPWLDPAEDDALDVRQYAVAGFTGEAVTFDGAACDAWTGSFAGGSFAVAGNTLASEDVVLDVVAAFEDTEGAPLAERLLEALEAGAARGGDNRCDPSVAAKSAFLKVAAPDDGRRPSVDLTASSQQGAVAELREKWEAGKQRTCHMQCSASSGAGGSAPVWLTLLLVAARRGPARRLHEIRAPRAAAMTRSVR
jgi:uncharacterized Ntn-hydrolase superfamily protein